jgi:hypothetical protein
MTRQQHTHHNRSCPCPRHKSLVTLIRPSSINMSRPCYAMLGTLCHAVPRYAICAKPHHTHSQRVPPRSSPSSRCPMMSLVMRLAPSVTSTR